MLNCFPVTLIVGIVLGFLSGLGVGGGSLLLLWLTLVLEMNPQTARSINLLFFLPSALIACFFRHRQGKLEIKPLLPGILSGCAAAGLFSWISAGMDVTLMKKGFGILLIAAGIRELFYRPRKPR